MFLGGTMAEGWACYATDLMDEIGFLDADESLAQQHTRARLLARAVVDIGLHDGSMTFDEAVAVYRDRRRHVAGRRARRSLQELDVSRARRSCTGSAPTAFTACAASANAPTAPRSRSGAFHDRLLSFGSIPVPLLRTRLVTSAPGRCALGFARAGASLPPSRRLLRPTLGGRPRRRTIS